MVCRDFLKPVKKAKPQQRGRQCMVGELRCQSWFDGEAGFIGYETCCMQAAALRIRNCIKCLFNLALVIWRR